MKTYKTLIKISKDFLDQRKRELSVFLTKRDELLENKRKLKEQLESEREFAEKNFEALHAFTNFSINVGVKQENLDKFVAKMDEEVEKISEQIAEAFAELKKYEIMLDRKEMEMLAEMVKKESAELDEIGLVLHRRKVDSGQQ